MVTVNSLGQMDEAIKVNISKIWSMAEEHLSKQMEENILVIGLEGNNMERERKQFQAIQSLKECGNMEKKSEDKIIDFLYLNTLTD